MSTMEQIPAYYADLSDDLEVAKFPEDFADWLMDQGREQDARQFLITIRNWKDLTPTHEQTISRLVEIADEYAPVVDFQEEIRAPIPRRSFTEALALLQDLEAVEEPDSDTGPLTWDREAELVNRAIADQPPPPAPAPVDMSEHEYPDVEVYVDDGETVVQTAWKTFESLLENGHRTAARMFLLDARALLHRSEDPVDLFMLIWSYVVVLPEFGSRIERRMWNR